MSDSQPFHYELREATRDWLNRVCTLVFDGNVSSMASALNYSPNETRQLRRVLRGQTQRIPRFVVTDTTELVDTLDAAIDISSAPPGPA